MQTRLYREQDKYLESIAEINKLHADMGMPQIRTEVRYAKASPEADVANLQMWPQAELPPTDSPSGKKGAKGKKGSKKHKHQADSCSASETEQVKQQNKVYYNNRSGYTMGSSAGS